jgi:hypothetical protein
MAMGVMGIPRFERFFRSAAELDVDKDDLKRFSDFVFEQMYDMLIRAQANAKANLRDVIEPSDLPITRGLQERIHEFEKLDQDIELEPSSAISRHGRNSTSRSARRPPPGSRLSPADSAWRSPGASRSSTRSS